MFKYQRPKLHLFGLYHKHSIRLALTFICLRALLVKMTASAAKEITPHDERAYKKRYLLENLFAEIKD